MLTRAETERVAGTGGVTSVAEGDELREELAGLDALELAGGPRRGRLRRAWSALWPKVGGIAIGLFLWQCVVWSGWQPEYILPGPTEVLPVLWEQLLDGTLLSATTTTLQRAFVGYAVALVIGVAIGTVVSQFALLRNAFGSLVTGLMTMPSIAWFPLAIVLFKISEQTILFVVVLGAAPAIAAGIMNGADHVPPLLTRAGRTMGASRLQLWRYVTAPASLPSFVAGCKQGWAFAWRSLMAGELLLQIPGDPSIGTLLNNSRNVADYAGMMATMVLILIIGVVVDTALFGTVEKAIRRRWGLLDVSR